MSIVGERLRTIRKQLHISQSELARRSGVSQSAISDIELSTKNPSVETIRLLANALGISNSELIGDDKKTAIKSDGGSIQEALFIFSGLTPDSQKQALSYLRFLSNNEEKK